EWSSPKKNNLTRSSATQNIRNRSQDGNSEEATILENKVTIDENVQEQLETSSIKEAGPFRSLSQADAEDLFESIARDTAIEINLPEYIEDYLKNLLAGNIDSILTKVKEPLILYQDQNTTIIYEQSYGPTEYDIKHYLEDMIKLARNSVDDLNQHFVQYSNSSVMTAKKLKAISIQGYKYMRYLNAKFQHHIQSGGYL
ncbi:1744_t:CDS:2, partial [Racocetra fulgida]